MSALRANIQHTILFLAGFLMLDTSFAHAQQRSGTYTMFVVGNAVSTENYTIVAEPEGVLRAEAEISISGSKRKTTTAVADDRPVRFLARAGETTLISAAFDGLAVKLQIAGQQERQLVTKAAVILV